MTLTSEEIVLRDIYFGLLTI